LASLLQTHELAVISDAQWVFSEPEMAMLGFVPFFKFRVLSSQFGFKKPDVRLFDMATKELILNNEDSVYIGDTPQKDLVGAKEAGMKFILFRSEEGADHESEPVFRRTARFQTNRERPMIAKVTEIGIVICLYFG
jgi:putative hydrolase of the HAD superfamily